MRAPLAVRILDGTTDRYVTREVTALEFSKAAVGGFAAAQIRLELPVNTFPDLGPSDRVWIYDGRTGATVWEGYAENPGVTRGEGGEGFDLTAIGPMSLPADESKPLIYVDRDLDGWEEDRRPTAPTNAEMSSAAKPGTETPPGLLLQFQSGQPVGPGLPSGIGAVYKPAQRAGLQVGTVTFLIADGRKDPGYQISFGYRGGVSKDAVAFTDLTTTARRVNLKVGTDTLDIPDGTNEVYVWLWRDGKATNVATGDVWTHLSDVVVCARRLDRHGAPVASQAGQSVTTVLAGWVVEDLVGRLLPVDPAACFIAPGANPVKQLAYPDGATARQVLDDLELYEPNMLWELLESGPAGHRFNYREWPTEPRYEVSARDGYDAPGGDADLCNRVAVYWTDETGAKQTVIVTSVVPELGDRVRDAESVTLPDGQGSAVDAQRIGQQILAAKSAPPKSARVTIRRPLMDRLTGRTVMPWELEPGYLARVTETGDLLRVTEMSYSDDQAATVLTLGEPSLTADQRIAALAQAGTR